MTRMEEEMEEEKKNGKDYTSGYDVPEEDEEEKVVFTEYRKKDEVIVPETRPEGMNEIQKGLCIACACAGVIWLLSFLIPGFNAFMHHLSPWNAAVPAVLFAVSLAVSKAGEKRPLQLFLISACVPAYHYLTVWFLSLPESILLTVLLAVLFLGVGAVLVFALDHRLVGRNEFPIILVMLPMFILAFSFSAAYAEFAPGWYLKLLAIAQGAILINASLSAFITYVNGRKKPE